MSDAPEQLFVRQDASDDALFYQVPRLVTHIDDATIAALTEYYREALSTGCRVLDLMSSWISHLPEDVRYGHVAGLGMNQAELDANPRLDERVVHDLNRAPQLPWPNSTFDAVLIAVSVQYLTDPYAVFAEIGRVLSPGGTVIVAMSHRCFPTKAIYAFHVLAPSERMQLVGSYMDRAAAFENIEALDRSPPAADPLWLVRGTRSTLPGAQ